jgi:hypothetical protein
VLKLATAALLSGMLVVLAFAGDADAKRKPHRAGAAAGQIHGVNLTPFQAFVPNGQSDADNQGELQSACRMGAGAVRVFVPWNVLEPTSGQVNPDYASKLDSLISQASACRIRVMFDLVSTPDWNTTAPVASPWWKWGSYPPRSNDEYRWIVAWILSRWPALLSLEVWNEPNFFPYWYGSAAQYAALVNSAVAAKREVGSSTQILAGALGSGDVNALTDYLGQLYAAGMSGQDGISIHPYSMYCSEVCRLADPSPATGPFRSAITGVHDVMLQHGDGGGLWLTEFGFDSCPAAPTCVPENVQARWTVKSIQLASCYPYVRGVVPFTVRDISGDPQYAQVWDAHFGLLRNDFSPKPAYAAVRATYRTRHGKRARKRAGAARARVCRAGTRR